VTTTASCADVLVRRHMAWRRERECLPGPATHLASHDGASLGALLTAAGGSASGVRTVLRRILRHVYPPLGSRQGTGALLADPVWTDQELVELEIGVWARPRLLALDPRPTLELAEAVPAGDGTIRLLLRARDGALIESVLIPAAGRTTLCISSQVGCARACTFCETGALGLARQLDASEIVDQVRIAAGLWQRELHRHGGFAPPTPRGTRLSNLVFMGMGEPFDNLDQVLRAVRLLTDHRALAFAPSRVTVSTVGVADKLAEFFAGARAELAVSLNAPDDARRDAIMPINRRVPLAALRDALRREVPPGRRVFFEYVLFDGFNDAPEDADLLAGYVRGLRCRVNVIPCNPGPDPRLAPPREERLGAFVARLASHGVTTLVRRPRGREVGGACGQLAGARRAGLT